MGSAAREKIFTNPAKIGINWRNCTRLVLVEKLCMECERW